MGFGGEGDHSKIWANVIANSSTQQELASIAALTPPSAPDMMDAQVIQAQIQKKRELAGNSGSASTFITGPAGLNGPSSSIAKDFILAKFRNTQPAPGQTADTQKAGSALGGLFSTIDQMQVGFFGKAK